MASDNGRRRPRRWFLRPLWRDPAFIFCFVVSVLIYGASLAYLWRQVTNPLYGVLVIAYFFLVWFLVCAIVSIPIGVIRGYWKGRQDAEESESRPELPRTKVQNVARVSGRLAGRIAARNQARFKPTDDIDESSEGSSA